MKFNVSKQTQKKNYFPGIVPCSTTLNFFEPVPVFVHECIPGSSFHVSMRNYVRTSVLNLPTYGDYKVLTKSVFVPFGDVYRPWDAFMSGTRYHGTTSFVPTKVPTLNPALVLDALVNSAGFSGTPNIGVISFYDTHDSYIQMTESELTPVSSAVSSYFKIGGSWVNSSGVTDAYGSRFRPQGKDFYLGKLAPDSFPTGTPELIVNKYTGMDVYISFSEQAKVIHRVLVALSIPLTNDSTLHSALPLLCYTKAVFDLFSPERTDSEAIPFESTSLYGIVYKCMGADAYTLTSQDIQDLFVMILDNTYYINNDFQSLFRRNIAMSQTESVSLRFVNSNGPSGSSTFSQSGNASYSENQTDFSSPHTNVTSDRLKAIFRIGELIKQNTLIGGKIREFMRTRFGASMSDPHELFEINSFLTDINISDIFATSSSSGEDGSVLGEYGGRALGRGNSSFSFSTDKAGMFFVISVALQNRHYYHGSNPSIHRIFKNDFFNPVFDSLGYSIAPFSFFYQSLDELTTGQDSSFAYIPRYSDYKFFKPVVNGDFTRYGVKDSIMGFIGNAYPSMNRNTRFSYTMELNKPAFYPGFYNTNHIFYDSENQFIQGTSTGAVVSTYYPCIDDPLILHTMLQIDMHAPMIGRDDVFETNSGDSPTQKVEY